MLNKINNMQSICALYGTLMLIIAVNYMVQQQNILSIVFLAYAIIMLLLFMALQDAYDYNRNLLLLEQKQKDQKAFKKLDDAIKNMERTNAMFDM